MVIKDNPLSYTSDRLDSANSRLKRTNARVENRVDSSEDIKAILLACDK